MITYATPSQPTGFLQAITSACPLLLYLPPIQVTLGIFVILTGKSFWITNFHVLTGLTLLVLSFLLVATLWGSYLRTPVETEPSQPHG